MGIASLKDFKKNIFKLLPYWFKAKNIQEGSNTASFLNPFIEEFYELLECIEKEYKKTDLLEYECMDYKCKKIELSEFLNIKVNGEIPLLSLEEKGIVTGIENNSITAYYDIEHRILYISSLKEGDRVVVNDIDITNFLVLHRIWNAELIEEFGLLYDMPRLQEEDNQDYKKRLISYSNTKGSSISFGLSSYIAHYLGLNNSIEWLDSSKDIIIKSNDVICRYIYVDNKEYIDIIKGVNSIIIKGNPKDIGKAKTITYFDGFDFDSIENLTEKEHDELMDIISIKCPIMWGYARWNDIDFLEAEEISEYHSICPKFDDISFLSKEG